MAREQIAGGIIVDQLRDRILSGMYLGQWRPGERLPSIRDVADAEHVDRKTAAAAYRRLQREGLVDVRARSGVYLREDSRSASGGPLQRLERRWLENTYETGHEIGLDTQGMIRLIGAVGTIEKRAIPVVESDWSQAEVLANELRERLGIRTVPFLISQIEPHDRLIAEAPFFITTPFRRPVVADIAGDRAVVQLILARDVLEQVAGRVADSTVLIVVPSEDVAAQIRRAIERGVLAELSANTRITVPSDPDRLFELAKEASCVFLWPGTPGWVVRQLEPLDCVIPGRCIADESLVAIRSALLDCAMRLLLRADEADSFNTTSAGAPRPRAVAAAASPGDSGLALSALGRR
jgi:DNA-binding transcriptional regulator YhcF (GntR family)